MASLCTWWRLGVASLVPRWLAVDICRVLFRSWRGRRMFLGRSLLLLFLGDWLKTQGSKEGDPRGGGLGVWW